jgi:hypothetical protein
VTANIRFWKAIVNAALRPLNSGNRQSDRAFVRRRILLVSLALLPALASSATALFGADMLSGTWEQNILKSTYNSRPAPTNPTVVKISAVPDGLEVVVDSIGASGQKIHEEYTAKFDGQDYPYYRTVEPHVGSTDANFVVCAKKIDDYTYEITFRQQGKVAEVQKHVLSKDGKTQIVTVTEMNVQSEAFNDTMVFEKQ